MDGPLTPDVAQRLRAALVAALVALDATPTVTPCAQCEHCIDTASIDTAGLACGHWKDAAGLPSMIPPDWQPRGCPAWSPQVPF